jgi:choline dehydrogenase-like flavoprotein
VEEATQTGGKFVAKSDVKKILIENGKATGVEYQFQGTAYTAYASTVIVSAGGMYSPKLLEKSGIEGTGRDFFFDPLRLVSGFVRGAKGGLREIPMQTGCNFQEEGYFMTDLTMTGMMFLPSILLSGKIFRLLSGKNALTIMIKVKDELSGHLGPKGRVSKSLGDIEKKRFEAGTKRAEQILKKAGAKSIAIHPIAGAHPGGTVKIGDVVDENLKTKIDSLYVCDASVIPEAWGHPPVLTVISLGKRLAKHIA